MNRARQMVERDKLVLTDDNPEKFLFTLFCMSRQPDRAALGFDQQDLEWCGDVWSLATIAALGNEEMAHWAAFYRYHCDTLKSGELEHGTMGYTYFDRPDEWPPARVIGNAIMALRQADLAAPGIARKPSLHRSIQ